MNSPLRTRLGAFVAVAASLCAAALSSGQETVALYNFESATFASSASSALAGASNLDADVVATRSGITGAAPRSYYERDYTNFVPGLDIGAAIAAGNYLGFTVTPTDGALNYLSLSFAYGASNGSASTSYSVSWAVFAGETGFTATDGNQIDEGSFTLAAQGANNVAVFWSPTPANVNLTNSAGLQNAALPKEFRIYYWDNYTTGNNNFIARFDDISLTASAIPEPSTYAALIGLAALGFVALRRRQARSA